MPAYETEQINKKNKNDWANFFMDETSFVL